MSIICVIPARLNSTRFPKKMLAPLLGKPLLQWTWEAANRVSLFDQVVIATDSEEIASVVEKFGGKYRMTSPDCASGTDRLIELRQNGDLHADVWVNWQGDEPFLNPQALTDLLQSWKSDGADVWTLKKKITDPHQIASPHICKVVSNAEGFALYFSRQPIPYIRDANISPDFFKHIGIYAFAETALQKLATLTPSPLEIAEQLEQLRFLHHGLRVRVHETLEEPFGIDLPEHLSLATTKLTAFKLNN